MNTSILFTRAIQKKILFWLLVAIIIFVITGVSEVMGQSGQTLRQRLSYTFDDARTALQSRDFQVAIPALREGLELATENRDRDWQARFHFQLGVALQQRSLHESSTTDLNEAAEHYETYLKLKPQTGSALNNLAQIYIRIGREGDASSLFARAVALEDDMMGFYALNYAEFLSERKVWGEAAGYYKKALEVNPDHPEAREGLLEAYQRIDQGRLISFIWDQIDRGRDVWAVTVSLDALANLPSREAAPEIRKQKVELLTCVAVGMSRARYGPVSKSKSSGKEADVFTILQKLTNDPDIGRGVAELLDAFEAPLLPEQAAQSWWSDKGDRYEDPDEGWWPRDGYRLLLSSLGSWYERRKDADTAEAYYMYAIHLTDNTDREPDLRAIVQLTDVYLASGEMAKIEALLNNTSTDLFFGKGQAYKSSNFKKIYTFHRTLGIMYALTEQWGDAYTITSAIFQLENALKTRDIFNDRLKRRQKEEEIPVEARLINLLARAYSSTDQPDMATELQLTYLGQAVKNKDRFTAREILSAMDYSQLEGKQARRYERLRKSAASL